jgi:hypothetical protein
VSITYTSTVDFDPGSGVDNHTSNGNWDVFLCKFDGEGNFTWAKSMGGTDICRWMYMKFLLVIYS